MCAETDKFQMPGIIYIILYHNKMCYYIIYNVPVKPQKTCRWFPTLFLIYTFENSGCEQVGGLEDQDKYQSFYSQILYIC